MRNSECGIAVAPYTAVTIRFAPQKNAQVTTVFDLYAPDAGGSVSDAPPVSRGSNGACGDGIPGQTHRSAPARGLLHEIGGAPLTAAYLFPAYKTETQKSLVRPFADEPFRQ